MVLNYKGRHVITVCTEQVRSPYTEHAASGLPNPTPIEGEVRFVQAQDQQVVTIRSPRTITECLLTRSMLIKMYVHAIYNCLCVCTCVCARVCVLMYIYSTQCMCFNSELLYFQQNFKNGRGNRRIRVSSRVI